MRSFKAILLSGLLFASAGLSAATLGYPYSTIYPLSATPYYFENGYLLTGLITNVNGTVFIDVNSQGGSAARLVGQYSPGVTVYNVNMWQSCDISQKHLYQKFLSNVISDNTTGSIVPIRMSSLEAAKALNVVADVIYIETNDQTLSSEILAWASHLTPTGSICGINWSDAQVQYCVAQAAAKLGYNVKDNGDFWYLSKN